MRMTIDGSSLVDNDGVISVVPINEVDNPAIIEELRLMYKNAEHQSRLEAHYNEWCYSNLRMTTLEKVFFSLYAGFNHKSKTKLLRTYIRACMRRNPDMVDKAKRMIDDGSYKNLKEW